MATVCTFYGQTWREAGDARLEFEAEGLARGVRAVSVGRLVRGDSGPLLKLEQEYEFRDPAGHIDPECEAASILAAAFGW